ncbi:MAG: hypothetical protein CL607_10575 [Anaerolineaceae bacterium]|nr:hypothetical protein [Anaerolineaceae bacterium]
MTEKRKREKTKNDARSTQTAIALVAALLVLGAGAFFFLQPATGTVVSNADAMQAEFEVAVTVAPSYPSGCNMMWQYGEDDALTTQLQAALDAAGITYEEAIMTTYGEQETCQADDGSYYDGDYLIMDYSPRITIDAADDEAGRGQQILALYREGYATLSAEDKTRGYLDVIFNLPDGEQKQWKASFDDVFQAIESDPANSEAIYAMGL